MSPKGIVSQVNILPSTLLHSPPYHMTLLPSLLPSLCRRLVFQGAVASVEFTLRADPVGSFDLLVSMFCDQLTDVRGHAMIQVLHNPNSPTRKQLMA